MPIDLTSLNPAQRQAVETTDGPLLVLAGAGSGKTRVLTYRIAHLVADLGVSPHEILAITFTNKAAAEMRERLGGLLGYGVRSMWVMTFHAMCVRMLRATPSASASSRPSRSTTTTTRKRMIKAVMAELELDDKRYPVNAVRGRISAAKSELIDAEAFSVKAFTPLDKAAGRIFARYQERMREANAMDFDDLLVEAHRLLAEHEDVRRAYQERFRYISVDEYQDTNHAQYRITNLLAAAHRNLMVVGDDDQSIYSWRGADIRNILEFERDYPEASRRQARAELPLHRAHPHGGERGRGEQRQPQAQDAVHRERRGREDRELPRERRAGRGPLHRRRDRVARPPRRPRATPTSPSSTARTRRAACSRTRCCAPACRTASSAARASSTAPRSATSRRT